MNNLKQKNIIRKRRHLKVRSKVSGTAERPRLSVFRSNKYIYTQLIDDINGVTLASASDINVKNGNKKEKAVLVGQKIAEAGKKNGISNVVFDRGGYAYAGRVKVLADSARKAGLKF